VTRRVENDAPVDESGRHHRNGHLLEIHGCMWRCLHCRHVFDAAVDAERFWCGEDCTGRHPGEMHRAQGAL
jgi:hypothetical protein